MAFTADDYEAIRQLLARYNQTLDFGDHAGFAACFTPDGVLDTAEVADDLNGQHTGKDALLAYAEASDAYSVGHVRLTTANSLIEGDGDTAKAVSYVYVTRDFGPPVGEGQVTFARLVTTGMYFDELRRLDGRWLLSRRAFRYDGTPDVLGRLYQPVKEGAFQTTAR
jgi:hypothetical protein